MMKKVFIVLFCLLSAYSYSQNKKPAERPTYPQSYFRNPLDIPILLAGNFGECRSGHFHSGLDIKTNGEENQPVHAAADGYISRIKMDKGGFGHALYITHANGYTTLYAHLNNFVLKIQKYLRQEQYKQEKWDIDVQLEPQQFPVKKGEQIAWSGNTGASTAPHLHFEIRDNKTEHPLNPELFGLPVIDKIPPVLHEVAIYDLNTSIYEQSRKIVPLIKRGKEYRPKTDTIVTGNDNVGIGINADDYMEGSTNTITFYTAKLYCDDSLQSEIILDNIGYEETRYINAYTDYKTKEEQGKWIQLFFKLPGNALDHIYHHLNNNKGSVLIPGGRHVKIRIEVSDDKANISDAVFYIINKTDTASGAGPHCLSFMANQANNFAQTNISFSLSDKALYDDICFAYDAIPGSGTFSDYYLVHHSYVPVHNSFELKIKPNKVIPFDLHDKIVLMYTDGKDTNGKAAYSADRGWYKASVRNFGTYWLAADTTAPEIRSTIKNGADLHKATQIAFTVRDEQTSVKRYRGEIDGKWVCFEQHAEQFFYNFDEHCSRGKHELVFTASDENNNTQIVRLTFTR